MDVSHEVPITDPASVLLGLGALAGLVAAYLWLKVGGSVGDGVEKASKSAFFDYIGKAAIMSAFAMGLASFGYLLGRFSGRF